MNRSLRPLIVFLGLLRTWRGALAAGLASILSHACAVPAAEMPPQQRVSQVANTKGLVAFWDFSLMKDGTWTSYHDPDVVDRGYPVYLRRIGDPTSYTPNDWPYEDEASKLTFDAWGPFGRAVRFNKGYVFAEAPRIAFDRSPLDLHGRQPFTLIAWVKFIGDP